MDIFSTGQDISSRAIVNTGLAVSLAELCHQNFAISVDQFWGPITKNYESCKKFV